MHKTVTTFLCLLACVLLLAGVPLVADDAIFTLEDPRGDDHGNGLLTYPLRSEFEPGDLDLLKLEAIADKDGTWFEATFARDVKKPGPGAIDELGTGLDDVARYGFYTFNIDLYIDTDRQAGSGAVALLPGRQAEVDETSRWEKAVILTPRPNLMRSELEQKMVKDYEAYRKELSAGEGDIPTRKELGSQIGPQIDERIFFPKQVRVRGRTIRWFVPDQFLAGPAQADWGYVVVVTGANLLQSFDLSASVGLASDSRSNLGVIPVSPGKWKDRFGGGRDDAPLQPPIVDILVPEGKKQESVLSDFNSLQNRPAKLPAVVPASPPAQP